MRLKQSSDTSIKLCIARPLYTFSLLQVKEICIEATARHKLPCYEH